MPGFDWQLGPIAHRGLHDRRAGRIENTASAIIAGIEKGYAIEVDLQRARGDTPVVFHDFTLDRLIDGTGPVRNYSALELGQMAYREGGDNIITLTELLDLVQGRVPLYIELKSNWSGDRRLEAAVANIIADYYGPIALMSFDPESVAAIRESASGRPLGLISRRYSDWSVAPKKASFLYRKSLQHLLAGLKIRPDFINYEFDALPAVAPFIARNLFGLPLMAWTVRTLEQSQRAERWADMICFEGFEPE